MLRTKIVCTVGPASRSPEMLRALMRAGLDVARLNFSFDSHEDHRERITRIRAAAAELNKPVAILADLQGPKLRVGRVPSEGVPLREGQELVLTTRPDPALPGEIPVQYEDLPHVVQPGHRILIDDGLLELRVLESTNMDIRCQVITGGTLFSNKGLNLPKASLAIPAITAKDREDAAFALEQRADWIAMSFVRTADEVLELKEWVQRQAPAGQRPLVMAKIEKPEAVDHIDAIIEAADGIMVARGDLGIETSPEEVPLAQKMIIAKCNRAGKPVVTATQMLDSMIRNPRPTRAEASDVANAILDGTDAIMLSGETAVGKYPVEAVRTMQRIAEHTERQSPRPAPLPTDEVGHHTIAEAVAHASCQTAQDLGAKAIITPTTSGLTARLVSMYRPVAPILAVTPNPIVERQLALVWGVHPVLATPSDTTDEMIARSVRIAQEGGHVRPGDLVVVTAGTPSQPLLSTPTNLMKVLVVGEGPG